MRITTKTEPDKVTNVTLEQVSVISTVYGSLSLLLEQVDKEWPASCVDALKSAKGHLMSLYKELCAQLLEQGIK